MSWQCPACQMTLPHREGVRTPPPGIVYRCPICHINLVANTTTGRLIIVPVRKNLTITRPGRTSEPRSVPFCRSERDNAPDETS